MFSRLIILFAALFIFITVAPLYSNDTTNKNIDSQLTTRNSELKTNDSSSVNEDSLYTEHSKRVKVDTSSPKPLNLFVQDIPIAKKKYEMTKSPAMAIALSLILPGMGQLYNESYWKVPLFLGASGALVYQIILDHNNFTKFQSEWENMSVTDPNKFIWQRSKEFYRDRRDQFAFYLIGVYILGAVDAYVGAHLYDFSVSDDLSLGLNAGNFGAVQAQLTLKW